MISDYFILALRNLSKRKLRSWLTMLGIIISIATIFVLISLSIGLQQAVSEQFRLLGTDKFFIIPKGTLGGLGTGGAVQLTINDVNVIEKVNGIKDVSYAVAGSASVEFSNQVRYFTVAGIPLERTAIFEELGSFKADDGRLFTKGDTGSVMLGSQFKYNSLYKRPINAGDKITINGEVFKVKAILHPIGNSGDDQQIYMPLVNFQDLFNSGDRVDQIIAQTNSGENLSDIAFLVNKKLMTSRGVNEKTKDFIILTPEELLGSFDTILNIITAFLAGVAAISLVVGGIGIMNTMYTSILERTREIGTMKAVGAKNSDILYIFLIESGLLGMMGGIIGVALGYASAKVIELIVVQQLSTNLLRAAAPWYLVLGCLLFAFFAGAISGVWPAWRASRIKIVDALRYE